MAAQPFRHLMPMILLADKNTNDLVIRITSISTMNQSAAPPCDAVNGVVYLRGVLMGRQAACPQPPVLGVVSI